MKKRNWHNYIPYLHLYIELPFLKVQTKVMSHAYEMATFEYIVLRIQLFKWSFEIELYDTKQRIMNRGD